MERMRMRLMQDHNLYDPNLMDKSKIVFGPISGVEVGAKFENRKACAAAGVHTPPVAGIHGSKVAGADSICLSGGYKDDKDEGEFFVYTGTGGQEDAYAGDTTPVGDQSFDHRHNAALKRSVDTQKPVRVVRGHRLNSKWAPVVNYRYDGLYIVENAYEGKSDDGYFLCKFDLRRLPNQPPLPERQM